jgi:hypothetical protein
MGAGVAWGADGRVQHAANELGAIVGQETPTAGSTAPAALVQQLRRQQQQQQQQQQLERNVEWHASHSWHTTHLLPFVEHTARSYELETAHKMMDERTRQTLASRSAWSAYDSVRRGASAPGVAMHDGGGGLPGKIPTPMRVGGGSAQELLHSSGGGAAATATDSAGGVAPPAQTRPSLATEVVTGIAAARYFSAVRTASGALWTFGGGFNGELGSGAQSWSPRAMPVDGVLQEVCTRGGLMGVLGQEGVAAATHNG